MSKRRTYLHNAALLTGSGLVLRALGMGFRVVLAAYLGSEGMGLYQLILALYMVFVSFATAGVNVASARLAAQSLARGSGMAETLRGLCITGAGLRHGGHAGPKRIGRAVRAVSAARRPGRDRAADFGPQSAVYGCVGRGAGVLFGRAAGAAEHHGAAHRTAGADGRRRGGSAGAGAVGRGLRLRRRAAGQHGQRERLLRHYAAFAARTPEFAPRPVRRCTPTPARSCTTSCGPWREAACWPAPCRRRKAA